MLLNRYPSFFCFDPLLQTTIFNIVPDPKISAQIFIPAIFTISGHNLAGNKFIALTQTIFAINILPTPSNWLLNLWVNLGVKNLSEPA